ncbi:MAG TPA: DUF802 domain-containing protein, partial [Ideonella sp.]|nr:DUF802 domain-containing protein [Ideonella sp.]
LKESLAQSARIAGATIQPAVEATMVGIARETTLLHQRVAETVQLQLDGVSERFGDTVTSVSETWRDALAQHQRSSENLSGETQKSLAAFAETFEQRSASLLATVDQAHGALQADLASQDQQRLAVWSQSLESMAASLQREWQQAGAQTLVQQEQICKTLDQTARGIAAQAEAHARNTIAEIAQLMQAASAAPRAAAEVIGQLRQNLSDSMARDNELLEERSRIMGTLGGLLDTVQLAATQQRGAIDSLVASSGALLERVGARFTETIEAESAKMATVAAQMTGSAVEVSSLGEAFGFAVQLFSESNQKLMAHLQRIEGSLDKSLVRSDEQLAYYVAQAREIIDLSIMSQKQIVEDLQQLALREAPVAAEVA